MMNMEEILTIQNQVTRRRKVVKSVNDAFTRHEENNYLWFVVDTECLFGNQWMPLEDSIITDFHGTKGF